MKRLSFLEKTQELTLYTDRYETVTLFEISQLYGSSLCAFLIFVLSLPLMIFSTQWVVLPISFCCIALGSLLLFDERLWLLDSLKRLKIASKTLKKITKGITAGLEQLKVWIATAAFYEQYSRFFRVVNPLLLIIVAFQLGFIQSPHTSYFSVFSLLFVSLGSFTDDGYLCLAGYTVFLFSLI